MRSGMNTSLDVGAGVWELRAAKASRPAAAAKKTKSTLKAIPSTTHMALVALQEAGLLHFLVSQNTDGLHRRSGFPPAFLAEVHGNSNLEYCKACGKQCLRDFKVRRRGNKVHNHATQRPCPACGAASMYDTIINFGESLPAGALDAGFHHCGKADVTLAMGSSLRVTPAADMPLSTAEQGGRLVIVNLQKTPLDSHAALVIHAKTDDVSAGLIKRLGVQAQPFALRRTLALRARGVRVPGKGSANARPGLKVHVEGVDSDGTHFSCVKSVTWQLVGGTSSVVCEAGGDPLLVGTGDVEAAPEPGILSATLCPTLQGPTGVPSGCLAGLVQGQLCATVHFQGHYREPPLVLSTPVSVAFPWRLKGPTAPACADEARRLSHVADSGAAATEGSTGKSDHAVCEGGMGVLLVAAYDPCRGGDWGDVRTVGEVTWRQTAAQGAAAVKYDGGQDVTKK